MLHLVLVDQILSKLPNLHFETKNTFTKYFMSMSPQHIETCIYLLGPPSIKSLRDADGRDDVRQPV